MHDAPALIRREFAVRADLRDALLNRFFQRPIKVNRRVPVAQNFLIWLDFIRHVGVAEHAVIQHRGKPPRMQLRGGFQQFQQVNNLMIAPIADIRPGIFRLRNFPFDAVARDAIRVVAVGGRGV